MSKRENSENEVLALGKLSSELLKEIVIDTITAKSPQVKVSAQIGEDCAVIEYGEYDCIVSTDPITASVNDIGRLAIHVSCNDIASNGVAPLAITLAVMLPFGTTAFDIKKIMEDAKEAALEVGVEIVGGHTEITKAVTQPIIVSTALGKAPRAQGEKREEVKQGDHIIITKRAGIEGTAIIASDCAAELIDVLTENEKEEAIGLFNKVSVVQEGIIAGKCNASQMHDVTEGGVLGALWETCQVTKLGAEVWEEKIPIYDVTKKICKHYNIDPLRLISSGTLIIIANEESKEEIIRELRRKNIECEVIGVMREENYGIKLCGTEKRDIMPPEADELYKVL